MRTLLLFILLFILYWWARRALTRMNKREKRGRESLGRQDGRQAEHMLACRHCGIHIPESEGVREGKDFFCSEAHRRLGVRR